MIILEKKDLTIVVIHGNSWQFDLTRTRGTALIAVRDPLQFSLNTVSKSESILWGRATGDKANGKRELV